MTSPRHIIPGLLLALAATGSGWAEDRRVIDIGSRLDGPYIAAGFCDREGPTGDRSPFFSGQTWRRTKDAFTLQVPVFPGTGNLVGLRMARPPGALLVEANGRPVALLAGPPPRDERYGVPIPADVVAAAATVSLHFRTARPSPRRSKTDPRPLGCALTTVSVVRQPRAGPAEGVVIDVGSWQDHTVIGRQFHGRRGPDAAEDPFFRQTYRWAEPGFTIKLPCTPGHELEVTLHMDCRVGTVAFSAGDRRLARHSLRTDRRYSLRVPAEGVPARGRLVLRVDTPDDVPERGNEPFPQFCALAWVGVRAPGLHPPMPASEGIKDWDALAAGYATRRLVAGGRPFTVDVKTTVLVKETLCWKPKLHLQREAALALAQAARIRLLSPRPNDPVGQRSAWEAVDGLRRAARAALDSASPAAVAAIVEAGALRRLPGTRLPRHRNWLSVRWALRALNRAGVPCHIVDEAALIGSPGRYHLLVIPQQPWIDDALWPALAEHVRAGGRLLVEASTPWTRQWISPAQDSALAEILGLRETPRMVPQPRVPLWPKPRLAAPLAAPARVAMPLSCQVRLPLWNSATEPTNTCGAPAITVHRLGQGRAAWVAAAVFSQGRELLDPLADSLTDAALESLLADSPPRVRLPTDCGYEAGVFRRDRVLVVTLASASHDWQSPDPVTFVEDVLSPALLPLRLALPARPRRATEAIRGQRLAVRTVQEGIYEVAVPEPGVFSIVEIEP